MFVDDLLEDPLSSVACFLCCWACTVDTLLTSEAGAGAGGVAGGLATGALGFSMSETLLKRSPSVGPERKLVFCGVPVLPVLP